MENVIAWGFHHFYYFVTTSVIVIVIIDQVLFIFLFHLCNIIRDIRMRSLYFNLLP